MGGRELGEEAGEGEMAAAGGYDDEIHDNEHGFIAPAIGAGISPETGAPDEDFFLNGAKHDENQADGGELRENAEGNAEASGKFGRTQENREWFAHADALAPSGGVLEMAEAAGQENESDHETNEKKRDIGVRGKFRERHWRSSKR